MGDAGGDLFRQGGNVPADIIQGILAEDGAVVHLHHETALGILAGAHVGGVPVHTDAAGLDIHTQDADIGKMFFQLGNQGLAIGPLGVQIFGKSHIFSFLSFSLPL